MTLISQQEFIKKNNLFNEDHLKIMIRKARAAGYHAQCGFVNDKGKIMVDEKQVLFWVNNGLNIF